tara:strand:+ start:36492 stop:36941 length:450 start_codon:yes stop_codon:yes gene_type:complete
MISAFLNPEMLSLLTGSVTGFIFKSMAEKRQNEQEKFMRVLKAQEASDDSADKAAQRVSDAGGKLVRRCIVICILFATIIAPFIIAFNDGITTVVEHTETVYGWWDLLKMFPEEKTLFTDVDGFLFTPENRNILVTIVGFYFGQAVKGK